MSKLYYRVYDGTNRLLVSTTSLCLAKAVLSSSDPVMGPYLFFVGGYAEDIAPFLPSECPCTSGQPHRGDFSQGKR